MSWSETAIEARVPSAAFPGVQQVTVEVSGASSAPIAFEVVLPSRVYVDQCRQTAPDVITMFRVLPSGGLDAEAGYAINDAAGNTYNLADPGVMFVHAATRRLFVSSFASISVFDINGATGDLTPAPGSPLVQPCDVGFEGLGLAINAAGTRGYVACLKEIAGFSIASNGMLTSLPGSPWVVDLAGNNSTSTLGFVRSEKFLFASSHQGSVYALSVGSDGALTALPGSPFMLPGVANPGVWRFESDAQNRLYFPEGGNPQIAVYSVDSAGTATAIAGSPFASPPGTQHAVGFTRDRKSLFSGQWNADGGLRRYSISDAGTISVAQASVATIGGYTSGVAFLTSNSAYVLSRNDASNGGSKIVGFSIDQYGTPTKTLAGVAIFPFAPLDTTACSIVTTP